MTQHTPGPWTIGPVIDSQDKAVYVSIYAEGRALSSVTVYGRRRDGSTGGRTYKDKNGVVRHARTLTEAEMLANAHLITSAPSLLAAAEAAAEHLRRLDLREATGVSQSVLSDLRAALAAARPTS